MSYSLIKRPKTARIPKGAIVVDTVKDGKPIRVARWTDDKGKPRESPVVAQRVITGPGQWAVKFKGANGKSTMRNLRTTSKDVADDMAQKIVHRARAIREGHIDLDAEALRLEEAKSILGEGGHLEDYKNALIVKNGDTRYAKDAPRMVERVIKALGVHHLKAIKKDAVLRAVSVFRDTRDGSEEGMMKTPDPTEELRPPLSAGRKNAHIVAMKAFTRWAYNNERLSVDPMRGLKQRPWNEETDRRLERRDLSREELTRLIAAARTGAKYCRMKGADRVVLYAMAFATGFRRSELKSMTASSFNLDAPMPTATVKACYSKNKRPSVQSLRPELVTILRPFLAMKHKQAKVFPTMPFDTASMVRHDLAIARSAWINEAQGEERARREADLDFLKSPDSRGLVVDFHGARHTAITRAWETGASSEAIRLFARHQSIEMTQRYSHLRLNDVAAAVPSLPELAAPKVEEPKQSAA